MKGLGSITARMRSTSIYRRALPLRRLVRARRNRWRGQRFYSQFIRPNDLCFDVGANIGQRSDIFLRLGARVVAVEPVAEAVAVLRQRFSTAAQLTILETALGAQDGEATLYACDPTVLSTLADDWLALTERTGRFPKRQIVVQRKTPVTTLDRLIQRYGTPAFIKIDVEGYELEVFEGLSSPVAALSFEFLAENLEKTAECLERLTELGAESANYSRGESLVWALPAWQPPNQLMAELYNGTATECKMWGDVYVRFGHAP